MTEKDLNRKIGTIKGNATRQIRATSSRKERLEIQARFDAKIEQARKQFASSKSTTCGCVKVSMGSGKKQTCCAEKRLYEVYTRDTKGKFIYLGRTSKNPLK